MKDLNSVSINMITAGVCRDILEWASKQEAIIETGKPSTDGAVGLVHWPNMIRMALDDLESAVNNRGHIELGMKKTEWGEWKNTVKVNGQYSEDKAGYEDDKRESVNQLLYSEATYKRMGYTVSFTSGAQKFIDWLERQPALDEE